MGRVMVCPISMRQFMDRAPLVKLMLEFDDGSKHVFVLTPQQFSTGSFGWHANPKARFTMENQEIGVQVTANLVVIGSKEAPRG